MEFLLAYIRGAVVGFYAGSILAKIGGLLDRSSARKHTNSGEKHNTKKCKTKESKTLVSWMDRRDGGVARRGMEG